MKEGILNQEILKRVEAAVPEGPFCFVIDAGILGSFENAKYLDSKDRFYIISVSSTRIKNTLDKVLDNPSSKKPSDRVANLYTCGTLVLESNNDTDNEITTTSTTSITTTSSNNATITTTTTTTTTNANRKKKMVAIAWKAKKDKIVYFYTNISPCKLRSKQILSKNCRSVHLYPKLC
ncbi:hypothetical protein DLAC_11821 [Tieghemostelium lacteum]|uniref:Uncharacterized protein n=1 Tax=Tieghemostelium lacteum TaxID=361077 RepID=A0A151Z4V7_TIELA|nr:hypothetical protein DLAC_11821 [Tieghemostelium lacteum]|eukprot:KYQ88834.1 hypothetical protein DLAC_11821 [Tieghemostelium lacteum]